jgi:hypothetical protein
MYPNYINARNFKGKMLIEHKMFTVKTVVHSFCMIEDKVRHLPYSTKQKYVLFRWRKAVEGIDDYPAGCEEGG